MAKSGLRGVPKLRRLLRRLPEDTTAEVRQAVQVNAERILADQRAGAPKRTGRFAELLRIVYGRDRLSARIGIIGRRALKQGGWIVKLLEFGTKSHRIRARFAGRGGKRILTNRVDVFGADVRHPGTRAQPFIFPALERNRRRAEGEMRQAVMNALDKASRGA